MAKHPLLQEREYRNSYCRLRNRLFLLFVTQFYAGFLSLLSVVSLLVWPAVDRMLLLTLCSAGLALCIALAEHFSRRRSLAELVSRGCLPRDWRPPEDDFC